MTGSGPTLAVAVGLAAAAQWALVVWALHAAVGRTMRARGDAGWRVRDTLLVSPLFAGGTLVAIAAADWALAQVARGATVMGPALAVAAGAVVVAAFGSRAVGKLY